MNQIIDYRRHSYQATEGHDAVLAQWAKMHSAWFYILCKASQGFGMKYWGSPVAGGIWYAEPSWLCKTRSHAIWGCLWRCSPRTWMTVPGVRSNNGAAGEDGRSGQAAPEQVSSHLQLFFFFFCHKLFFFPHFFVLVVLWTKPLQSLSPPSLFLSRPRPLSILTWGIAL